MDTCDHTEIVSREPFHSTCLSLIFLQFFSCSCSFLSHTLMLHRAILWESQHKVCVRERTYPHCISLLSVRPQVSERVHLREKHCVCLCGSLYKLCLSLSLSVCVCAFLLSHLPLLSLHMPREPHTHTLSSLSRSVL